VNDEDIRRIGLGLPAFGTGAPGTTARYNLNGREIITGVFGADGNEKPVNGSIISYQVREATGQLPNQRPITMSGGGYSYHQDPNDPDTFWVNTPEGGMGRLNIKTGDVTPIIAGTPKLQVTLRNSPSGTGTEVWTHDDQGHATLASTNVDTFAQQLKRYEPHVTTANGTTTVTWVDRATGDTTITRDRDPLAQAPQVRTVGGQLAITNMQPNAEGTDYNTTTQFRTPPLTIRDILGTKVSNSTGTTIMIPTTNEDGTPGPPRQVLVPGTRGELHFDSHQRGDLRPNWWGTHPGRADAHAPPVVPGPRPLRRDRHDGPCDGRLLPGPSGGPQDRGRRRSVHHDYPATAHSHEGGGVSRPEPRPDPLAGTQSLAAGDGDPPGDDRGIGRGANGRTPRRRRPDPTPRRRWSAPGGWSSLGPADSRTHRYRWSRWVVPSRIRKTRTAPTRKAGLGQYGVQSPSQSQFGLPDTMRLPEPQYYKASPDIEDYGDTSQVGYDEADMGDGAIGYDEGGSYGDEEDTMNRRRRVGAGQADDDQRAYESALAAYRALSGGGASSGSPYNGGPEMPNPYGDFTTSVAGFKPVAKKGFNAIKGDDGQIYSFNEDTGELANVAPGSGTQEREFGLKERQLAQSERQSSEANAIAREKIGVEREQNQIAADPRKFRLQPHVIDLGRGGTAVYDPETGMVQQVTPREPGDVRGIGRDIYVPAGQTVNAQYGLPGGGGFSAQISGGPYNGWVPTRNTPGLPFGASGGPAGGYRGQGGGRRGVVSAVACLLVGLVAMAVLWGRPVMDQWGEWLAAAGTAPWEVQVAVGLTVAVVLMVAAVLVSRPR
jgi:hypothetical protein